MKTLSECVIVIIVIIVEVDFAGYHQQHGRRQDEQELVEKSRSEIHCEAKAIDEEKSGGHCFSVQRGWSKKRKMLN